MSVEHAETDASVDADSPVDTRWHVGGETTLQIVETEEVTVVLQRHDRADHDEVQAALDELASAADGGDA